MSSEQNCSPQTPFLDCPGQLLSCINSRRLRWKTKGAYNDVSTGVRQGSSFSKLIWGTKTEFENESTQVEIK